MGMYFKAHIDVDVLCILAQLQARIQGRSLNMISSILTLDSFLCDSRHILRSVDGQSFKLAQVMTRGRRGPREITNEGYTNIVCSLT